MEIHRDGLFDIVETDMTKLTWSRDGDQYVARLNGREARITEWDGPLGPYFELAIDGKGRGGSGGGARADALKRAKANAVEMLTAKPMAFKPPPAGTLMVGSTEDEMEQHARFCERLCGL